MGYNIGVRLIEDFLSKSRQTRCKTMTETAEVLKDAFRQYINVTPQVTNWNSEQDAFRYLIGRPIKIVSNLYRIFSVSPSLEYRK